MKTLSVIVACALLTGCAGWEAKGVTTTLSGGKAFGLDWAADTAQNATTMVTGSVAVQWGRR